MWAALTHFSPYFVAALYSAYDNNSSTSNIGHACGIVAAYIIGIVCGAALLPPATPVLVRTLSAAHDGLELKWSRDSLGTVLSRGGVAVVIVIDDIREAIDAALNPWYVSAPRVTPADAGSAARPASDVQQTSAMPASASAREHAE